MLRVSHEFDWPRFWLQEVVILSIPTLIMVLTSREEPPLSKNRLVILFVVFIGLTMVNRVLSKSNSVKSYESQDSKPI